MTAARLKRLDRLEARKPRGTSYFDVAPFALPIFAAMLEGRPFSWWTSKPDVELSPKAKQGIERILRDQDRIAERLTKDDREGCAKAEADRERRLNATLRAIEREQAAREAA
jgi:hypothetical protein